ncbi:hypothetical protein [Metallosphaera hakonensis]|uniref:hypothetical protein n=1 Tax=Metallosphaera hakonensis TaxID=79601 RepID=UPI002093C3F2|nr:hypothetical protein [Metallosphaera hakonensis]
MRGIFSMIMIVDLDTGHVSIGQLRRSYREGERSWEWRSWYFTVKSSSSWRGSK